LLLAAAVRSFAHMPLGISDRNNITATPHYYRKTFCSYSYNLFVHFTASTIWSLRKL